MKSSKCWHKLFWLLGIIVLYSFLTPWKCTLDLHCCLYFILGFNLRCMFNFLKNEDHEEQEELNMDGYKESVSQRTSLWQQHLSIHVLRWFPHFSLLFFQELVDWNKPMVAQVGKLGAEYIKWVHSPVDRPLRLFGSEFIEFFSKTPWYVVPVVWLPVVLYLSIVGMTNLSQDGFPHFLSSALLNNSSLVILMFVGFFLFGVFLWTLVEYVLHRYLFHITPPDDSPFWITFHFFLHGQHHKVGVKRLSY